MEDIFDDNDGIQVVSLKNKDDVQYAAPEIVAEDKQGKPKGEVHGIKNDGGVLNGDKLTNEERERARVQSLSSVRIFATYTNNNEPVDSPLHSVTFAGTGTMVCKAPDTKDTVWFYHTVFVLKLSYWYYSPLLSWLQMIML